MFLILNFKFLECYYDKKTINYYDEINNHYDKHFEFHNIMLIENKVDFIFRSLIDEEGSYIN
jgi:hypothetical protein